MEPRDRPPEIHQLVVECADGGRPFALVTVLRTDGSTPVKIGTKAIVDSDGSILGTVGGGAVEAEAQRRAVEAIRTGQPFVFDYLLQGMGLDAGGPICGGKMRVLVDPNAGRHRVAYAEAAAARAQRQRSVLLTTVRSGSPLEVRVRWLCEEAAVVDAEFAGSEAARAALHGEAPRLVVQESPQPEEGLEVLVEPLVPPPRLLIVGGGHVGQAVARQASLVGFEIVVLDDREEFTHPALFPAGVATRCGAIAREVGAFPFTPDTFVVLVTRGAEHDAEALAACIHRPVAYLGMIGSRRKVGIVRREFIESGRATEAEFDRVHAPVGLDLGAVTVPEIAASIVAQLIAVRRRGSASRMPTA